MESVSFIDMNISRPILKVHVIVWSIEVELRTPCEMCLFIKFGSLQSDIGVFLILW